MNVNDLKQTERRYYIDNSDWLDVLWDTANRVAPGKVLIYDKEEHSEVEISYVISATRSRF